MHTHYFVHSYHGTKAQNKLQKEVSDFLCSLDGKLIDAVDLKEFQKIVLDTIEALNQKHNRCKPIKVNFENSHSQKFIRLTGFYVEIFHLHKATLTHLLTVAYYSPSNN